MVLVTKTKRPSSIHHKRRHGQHHKQSTDYHKPYWPYLPIGLIIGLGLLVNTFWGVVQQAVLGYATNTTISGLLDETNVQRSSEGLTGLALNTKLNSAAQAKAEDMAARNYWSHNTPEGNPPWVFFSNVGYDYKAAGENLAYGFESSNSTVIAWMNSPGHRANIMNSNFSEVGFGIVDVPNYQDAGEQTIVVAMYGAPQVASAPVTQTPQAQAPEPQAQEAVQQPVTQSQSETALETNQVPEIVTAVDAQNELAANSQRVARIQLMTADAAPWTMFAVSSLAAVAIAALFLKHGLLWRRVLVKGEAFVVKHKFLDIALVLVGVLGFVLTRTAGTIH